MIAKKTSGLLIAILLLGACDKDPTPPKTPPAPAAPAVAETPAPAAQPAAKPAAKAAPTPTVKPLEPLIKTTLEPLPTKAPVVEQAEKPKETPVVQARPPQPPDKIQRLQVKKPQTAQQQKASEAVKQAQVPKAKLDLHLPKDMVNKLEPEVAVTPGASPAPSASADPALLPQMFAEKPGEQSPFEVGGRVITNDRSRNQDRDSNFTDTVEGAELQFKFRH